MLEIVEPASCDCYWCLLFQVDRGAHAVICRVSSEDAPQLLRSTVEDDVLSEAREALLLQAKSRPDKGLSSTLKFGTIIALRVATNNLARRVRAGVKSRKEAAQRGSLSNPTDSQSCEDVSASGTSHHMEVAAAFAEDVNGEAHAAGVASVAAASDESEPCWLSDVSKPQLSQNITNSAYNKSVMKVSYQFSRRGIMIDGSD